MKSKFCLAGLLACCILATTARAQQELWPDLSAPPKAVGGGEKDAAVIVGAENYFTVEHVPGAQQNANDWQAYLTETLKVPSDRVTLLRDNEATLEKMRKYAKQAASEVAPGGTLWFVFIGHGAPSKDGKDGLLVGVDAQQDPDSLYERSLPRGELLSLLSKGKQERTVVLIDACFSGKSSSGKNIVEGLQPLVVVRAQPLGVDPRTILLTAGKSDQFAGPLPKADKMRPAFSYLALGALRGWAADPTGKVTAGEIIHFADKALKLDHGRTQTPELAAGSASAILGHGRENAPDLAKIDREGAASFGGVGGFRVSAANLPSLPAANAPKALESAASGMNWQDVDVDALEKYNEATKLDKSDAPPSEKAASWRQLAKDAPKFADLAGKRADEWDSYEAQWKAAQAAEQQRLEARDKDWEKLGRLLALEVIPEGDKHHWSADFLKAYWKMPGIEPEMAKALAAHLKPGEWAGVKELALKAPKDDNGQSGGAIRTGLFSSKSGDWWEFERDMGGKKTTGTSKKINVGDFNGRSASFSVDADVPSGGVVKNYYLNSKEGLYTIGTHVDVNGTVTNSIYEPPMLTFPKTWKIGAEWEWKGKVGGTEMVSHYQVTGREKATVPAGSFDCYVLKNDLDAGSGALTVHVSATQWFSPLLGQIVRQEMTGDQTVLTRYGNSASH